MQIYRSAFFNAVGQATNSNQQQPTVTNMENLPTTTGLIKLFPFLSCLYYFQTLNVSLNFFSWIRDRQSIKTNKNRSNSAAINPATDCQESIPFNRLSVFSVANLPINTAMLSLVNFPAKKAGIIYMGFIFAIPPATNKGVEGNGINV